MHTTSYELLMQPKDSAELSPDPLLVGGVWARTTEDQETVYM